MKRIVLLIIIVLGLCACKSCFTSSCEPEAPISSPLLCTLPDTLPSQLIEHTGFLVSFNCKTLCPNYVAWELKAEETDGLYTRDGNNFEPDTAVPAAYQVTTDDYKGSGFDRGHMCPAADQKWSARAMTECFLLTNICPQDHGLNAGAWAVLEKACRRWATQEGAVLIACGPLFTSSETVRTIGRAHRVQVPERFFKVVVSLREGQEKAIAFLYNNTPERQRMETACLTVDSLEALTGYDFFPEIPDSVETRIESTCRLKSWR